MNNPTIVSAALSDKELQDSINKMVANFDKGLQDMLDHSNKYVEKIQESLQKIGNTNFGAKGSNDGGVVKQTKAQNDFTDAVKKSTDEIKNQGKQGEMSLDQIQGALQMAMREVRKWESHKTFSTQDLDKYQASLARVVELNEKLKRAKGGETYTRFDELSKRTAFDAKATIRDLTAVDDRLKQLNNEYKKLEAESKKAFGQDLKDAFKLPTTSLDEVTKKILRLKELAYRGQDQGFISQSQIKNIDNAVIKLRELQREMESKLVPLSFTKQTEMENKALQEQKEHLERIKSIAKEVKEDIGRSGFAQITNYKGVVYAENDARSKGLTIEQQIEKIIQEENAARNARLSTEKQITQEVEKQKKEYVAPSSYKSLVVPSMLRPFVEEKLGLGFGGAITSDATSKIKTINAEIKQLNETWQKMSDWERKSPFGDTLRQRMQMLQRQSQQLNQQLSRPVSLKDALSGSEKTLDDIAYKMQRLSSYRSGLNVETQTKEIDQVNRKYAELQKKMDEVMAKNSRMASSNNILANSWRYMRNRLAFYLTVSSGMTLVRDIARVRSEYEMNEKALGTLLNSAERGTRIFNELSNMALVSPYTLIELSAAAKQLTAYDVATKDVVDTTRRLADISAAVGVPVERLTYALGQVKAYGHLMSQDARQFLNAGVPLVKELANRYSELEGRLVSTADVYDRMKKHAISYNDVLSVLTSMTDEGGKFFDYQAKMAETLKVRLANLTLAYNNMLNDMGRANGGVFTTGIKGLTQLLKHWREIERILGTVVATVGVYRAATLLAGITTRKVSGHSVAAWLRWANAIRITRGNVALLSATMKAIPFVGWATAIASLVSYFVLFNKSSDETKQKLQDIATAFDGIRKEATDLFADAISTDSLGTQLTKLKDMLELAETELGITIPINIEDVNESNVKQKLRETKNTIDNYVNFSQTFSEAAVDSRFNDDMVEFGTTARSVYTSVSESVNSVKEALQSFADQGRLTERGVEILKELDNKPKDGESRIEYLQRLVKLYEELGLIGEKKVEPMIGHNFFKAFFTSTWDNMEELEQSQEENLDRLGIKNKTVFETMLSDVQGYYSKSSIAAYQLEQQVERVAKSINLENIPIEERTAKLEVAINQEAAKNNWNEFAIQYAKWVANQKFGLNITISEESKKDSEIELSDWQKRMQAWANKNGITFSLNFIEKEGEKAYADRMLQAAKDAQNELDVQRRKLDVGTGSQAAVDAATKEYKNARILALQAGADLSSLDKKSASSRKAASKAESELAKALKDELSTIDKVRSIYKDLTKEGMSHANAVERATKGWDETVSAINKVFQKNGLQKLDLSKFAGIENPRELVNMLQSQLNTLLKRGAKPAEIKELQTKVNTLEVDADKYDLTKITKGLNSELDRLKEEYELAVAIDADPEMGNLFADWMGFDMSVLPHTAEEYAKRMTKALNKYLADEKSGIEIGDLLALTDDDLRMFQQRVDNKELTQVWVDNIVKNTKEARNALKKENSDIAKDWDSLIQKYAEYEYKIAQVQRNANKERKAFALKYGTNDQKERALVLTAEIDAEEDQAKKQELINQLKQLLIEIAGDDDSKLKIKTTIDKKELEEGAKVSFEEFQKSPEWIVATGDLAGMTSKAIGGLIDSIESYKKKAKNLDPKQVKNINNALRKLYKQQREGNPFLVISNAIDQAEARMEDIQPALDSTMSDIIKLEKEIGDTEPTEEQAKALDKLKKKWKELYEVGQLSASDIVSSINSAIDVAVKASESFNKMAEALGGTNMTKAAKTISDITGNLQAAGQGAAAGAQLGGGWGAAIGATVGGLTDLVTRFYDQWTGNKAITEGIEESVWEAKKLENAYKSMEYAAEGFYGASVIGIKEAMKANKELQLAELKRQLQLEQQRDSKQRDEEKIRDLQGQIIDLEHEIAKATTETINDLLGVSSHVDFFENMISEMISAFKNGEDAMKVFEEKWSDMIDNMVMKAIIGRVMSQWIDSLEKGANKIVEKYTKEYSQEKANNEQKIQNLATMDAGDFNRWLFENERTTWRNILNQLGEPIPNESELFWDTSWFNNAWDSGLAQRIADMYRKGVQSSINELDNKINNASLDAIDELLNYYGESGKEIGELLKTELPKLLEQYEISYGQDSQSTLSALQQGIQGITEDTAGALEGITNGISQQSYLQSDLLTQIRDAVVSMDMDVSLGVMSQILLQLQNSYQTQQAIQQILEGVLNPSGRAFSVELIS